MNHTMEVSIDLNPHKILQIHDGSDHLIILTAERKLLRFEKNTSNHMPIFPELEDISTLVYIEGKNSYIGFSTGLITIVDMNFKEVRRLHQHQEEVIKLILDDQNNCLYSFSEDCSVLKWSLK